VATYRWSRFWRRNTLLGKHVRCVYVLRISIDYIAYLPQARYPGYVTDALLFCKLLLASYHGYIHACNVRRVTFSKPARCVAAGVRHSRGPSHCHAPTSNLPIQSYKEKRKRLKLELFFDPRLFALISQNWSELRSRVFIRNSGQHWDAPNLGKPSLFSLLIKGISFCEQNGTIPCSLEQVCSMTNLAPLPACRGNWTSRGHHKMWL
jgi:hypothetical protein